MRYPPELVDRLAAEYVVGTLHGSARRRFESLLRERGDVRYATWYWERATLGLTAGIAPVTPPRSVWRSVRRRVDADARRRHAPRRWPLFALATSMVAAAAFWLGTLAPLAPVAEPERIAVFADESAQALWVVSADVELRSLVVETAGVAPAGAGRVYELWTLPPGEAPRSLGLLEPGAGRYERTLTAATVDALQRSSALAISLEPPGGSPTGAPTGPVVFQASLVYL